MGRNRIWIPEATSPVTESIVELPPIGIGGYFYVDLIDAKSGEIKQHLEFPNLITDAGLDLIGTGVKLNVVYNELAVGTGTSTPAVTDTALDAQVDSTTSDNGIADADGTVSTPREYAFRRRTRVFLEGEANADLTELGWKVGSTLANRALFKDLAGNSTTVFKTDNDLLQISYEYRIFAPTVDLSGSFDLGIGSGSTSYMLRPQNVGQADGWGALRTDMGDFTSPFAKVHETAQLGSRTGNNDPSPSAEESSNTFLTYTSSNFFRDMEYEWTYSDAVFGSGIGLITWNPWFSSGNKAIWQMFLSSSLEKTNTNKFTIRFRQRWDRV